MKYFSIACLFMSLISTESYAQKIDSIYFHLYTDSLKKGVYNYINVDGLLSNGNYYPLDTTQLLFSSSDGKWVGNNLILDKLFDKKYITISAQLKHNPSLQKTVTIYIKQKPDDERLKTEEEIMNETSGSRKRRHN